MKLWLLKRTREEYDTYNGLIIRAETEQNARNIAKEIEEKGYMHVPGECWLDEKLTTCTEIFIEGEPGVVLDDYNAQ